MAITHVDHVLIAVSNLTEAAQQYEKLGFSITEGGEHPGRGTANRLAVLDPEYLELITVREKAAAWPELVAHLERFGDGLFTFAFASDDLAADVAAFRARTASGQTQLQVTAPAEGALRTPGGKVRGWQSARVEGGGAVNPFLIHHDSTGAEKRAKLAGDQPLQPHPLSYRHIDRIAFAFPTLAEGIAYFQDGYGLVPEGGQSVCPSRQADRVFFPLEHGQIEVIAPRSADSPVAAFIRARGYGLHSLVLAVPDPLAAADQLEARGIKVDRRPSGSVAVDPGHALGVRLSLIRA
jgi:4-hydroxyphenylpyruvate dioxygenase-like putative hemolysin